MVEKLEDARGSAASDGSAEIYIRRTWLCIGSSVRYFTISRVRLGRVYVVNRELEA